MKSPKPQQPLDVKADSPNPKPKRKPHVKMGRRVAAPGQTLGRTFGRLTVIEEKGTSCVANCLCGTVWTGQIYRLYSGATRSCGCLQRDTVRQLNRTHRHTSGGVSKLYRAWNNMKSRCYRDSPVNHRYKEKGIKVCRRWKSSFENFAADVGEPPTKDHTIERIDNDGHYTPENVCWATRKVQGGNTCRIVKVTAFGQTKTLAQWSQIYPVSTRTLWNRIWKGWNPEKDLTTPVRFVKRWHSI